MTTCTIILASVTCTIDPSTRVPPAEAAAIMASHQIPIPPPAGDGPTFVVFGGSPTDGPFGEFAPLPPPQRLDGTLLSQPPLFYGRAYVNGRPGALFGQRLHLQPPVRVGTSGVTGGGLPRPRSAAGVTTTSGRARH